MAAKCAVLRFRNAADSFANLVNRAIGGKMHINWIDVVVLVGFGWITARHVQGKIKGLEAEIRQLQIRTNTHEMNIERLTCFTQIIEDPDLSANERRALQDELNGKIADLADQNKALMRQAAHQ